MERNPPACATFFAMATRCLLPVCHLFWVRLATISGQMARLLTKYLKLRLNMVECTGVAKCGPFVDGIAIVKSLQMFAM